MERKLAKARIKLIRRIYTSDTKDRLNPMKNETDLILFLCFCAMLKTMDNGIVPTWTFDIRSDRESILFNCKNCANVRKNVHELFG